MPRKISYGLFAAALIGVIVLRLGNALLAGLLSYMVLAWTYRKLSKRLNDALAKILSIVVFLLIATAMGSLLWLFVKLTLTRVPAILDNTIPRITEFASAYSIELPFGSFQDLRQWMVHAISENVRALTLRSGAVTLAFFQVIIGLLIALMRFLETRRTPANGKLQAEVRREFAERMGLFMHGFERVMGAQLAIATLNTALTAAFLIVMHLPFQRFLILATFIFGMLPVIGNIISNTLIAGTALMLSPEHAVFVLLVLALIHKLEYLINSHMIGSRVDLPTWQVLLGILIGNSLLGIPGIILAPAAITHLRRELETLDYRP